MSKPTYEYLEAQVKQLEADNEKAMSVLKEANDAVLLAKSKFDALAAENAGLIKFIAQSCYVYNGDGSDISDAYTPAHESPMMPKQPNYLLPVAAECMALRDAFIRYLASENLSNKPDADELRVYAHCEKWVDAMCATPATDAFLAEVRAQGVAEYASKRGFSFQHGSIHAHFGNGDVMVGAVTFENGDAGINFAPVREKAGGVGTSYEWTRGKTAEQVDSVFVIGSSNAEGLEVIRDKLSEAIASLRKGGAA